MIAPPIHYIYFSNKAFHPIRKGRFRAIGLESSKSLRCLWYIDLQLCNSVWHPVEPSISAPEKASNSTIQLIVNWYQCSQHARNINDLYLASQPVPRRNCRQYWQRWLPLGEQIIPSVSPGVHESFDLSFHFLISAFTFPFFVFQFLFCWPICKNALGICVCPSWIHYAVAWSIQTTATIFGAKLEDVMYYAIIYKWMPAWAILSWGP